MRGCRGKTGQRSLPRLQRFPVMKTQSMKRPVRDALNNAMRRIQCSLQKGEHPSLEVTYFVPDERKAGGRYETVSGMIRKLDVGIGYLFLMDGQKIRIQDISSVDWIKTEKTTDQSAMS